MEELSAKYKKSCSEYQALETKVQEILQSKSELQSRLDLQQKNFSEFESYYKLLRDQESRIEEMKSEMSRLQMKN